MVPIDSSLKHASTSILLCQIISSFAKDTSVFKNCKNGNLFFLLFYTTDLSGYRKKSGGDEKKSEDKTDNKCHSTCGEAGHRSKNRPYGGKNCYDDK